MTKSPSEQLEELMLMQYRNSPNLIKYLNCYAEEMAEVYDSFKEMQTCRYYDVAEGERLDVIGSIVGAKRILEGIVVAGNFGYLASPEAQGMGRQDTPSLGGPFRSIYDPEVGDIELADERFRNWIDARIIKNHTSCNVEDTIAFFRLLLNNPGLKVEISNPAPATAKIKLHKRLNIFEAALVKSLAEHMAPLGTEFIVEDTNGEIPTLPVRFVR